MASRWEVPLAVSVTLAVAGLVGLVLATRRMKGLRCWAWGLVVMNAAVGAVAFVLLADWALAPTFRGTGIDYAVSLIVVLAAGCPLGAVVAAWIAVLLLGLRSKSCGKS